MITDNTKKHLTDWVKKVETEINSHHKIEYPNLFKAGISTKLEVKFGSKNMKIIKYDKRDGNLSHGSCWGFVSLCYNPNKNLRLGDLLKPATWKTPAKHARGNVLDGTASYEWTGPSYLN